MGLGDTKKIKSFLRRFEGGWVPKKNLMNKTVHNDEDEHVNERDYVGFVISDFLIDVNYIGHNKGLEFNTLVNEIQKIVLNYILAFPKVKVIMLLLDEKKHVPLGKVPTQDKRKKPLTDLERSKLINGGVLKLDDHGLQYTIDKLYKKEPNVKNGKATAFSIFFERYLRTHELRENLAEFVCKCILKLFEDKKIQENVSIYIDGMSISSFYGNPERSFSSTEDDDGNKLNKLKSGYPKPNETDCFENEDEEFLAVCKLGYTNATFEHKLSIEHPMHSCFHDSGDLKKEFMNSSGTYASPLWIPKHDGDGEIFNGFKGNFKRVNMGESDIKISYYCKKMIEMCKWYYENNKESFENQKDYRIMTCYISSADTDIIPILLLMLYGTDPLDFKRLDILLDTKRGNSCSEIININMCAEYIEVFNVTDEYEIENDIIFNDINESNNEKLNLEESKKFLEMVNCNMSEIMNITELYMGINKYAIENWPHLDSSVAAVCVLFLLTGDDYVESFPGIGFEKLKTVFEIGGYIFLSDVVKYTSLICTSNVSTSGMATGNNSRFADVQLIIDEKKIKQFMNLVYRYTLKIGSIGEVFKIIRNSKTTCTHKLNNKKRIINSLKNGEQNDSKYENEMGSSEYEYLMKLQKEKQEIENERKHLDEFLPVSFYDSLKKNTQTKEDLIAYVFFKFGLKDHIDVDDWEEINKQLVMKRTKQINTKRKGLLSKAKTELEKDRIMRIPNKELVSMNKDVTSILDDYHIESTIRTISWNIMYWKMSIYICPRETKYLNSVCRIKDKISFPPSHRAETKGDIQNYFETPKKRKLEYPTYSLNGFLKMRNKHDNKSSESETSTRRKKRKKIKIIHSNKIYPASKIVIDLTS